MDGRQLERCNSTATPTDFGSSATSQIPQAARDVYTLVKRGDLNACSFAFLGTDEDWSEEEDDEEDGTRSSGNRIVVRNITNFHKLVDCSVVSSPAYPGTSVDARNIVAAEVRSKAKTILTVKSDPERNAIAALHQMVEVQIKHNEEQATRATRRNLLNSF